MTHRRRQAGDTIIEVMIALAVIGAVIGTSYAISSRSLKIGRQAQERTESLKLVESQIELLKVAAQAKNANIYSTNGSFCLGTDASGVKFAANDTIAPDYLNDPLTSNPSPTANNGAPIAGQSVYNYTCAQGTSSRYKISITRLDTTVSGVTSSAFTVRSRWEKLGGGIDEVKLVYRIHKGLYQ